MKRDDMKGTVLITGASSGIGHATAGVLAEAGFKVYAGVRKETDAESIARHGGGKIEPLFLDVADSASIRAAAEDLASRVGEAGLSAVVNNAGIAIPGPVEYLPTSTLRHQFEVNVFGQIAVTQAMLPLIRRARGRIVNIGSVIDAIAMPFCSALSASKAAFALFTDALRLELAPWGIRVVLVRPGTVKTPAADKMEAEINHAVSSLPRDGHVRYRHAMKAFGDYTVAQERDGSPPLLIARTVLRALTDSAPSPHYHAGKGSLTLTFMTRFMPTGTLDAVRRKLFGLPGFLSAGETECGL